MKFLKWAGLIFAIKTGVSIISGDSGDVVTVGIILTGSAWGLYYFLKRKTSQ